MLFEESLLFITGFLINAISAFIIIRGIYYSKTRDYEFIFTFLVFNTLIYFIMGLFTSVALTIGVGFGLFALFSVLRYRTESVPIREMTYLFVMVALPVLNSVLYDEGKFGKLLLSNLIIIAVIWVMEREFGFRYEKKLMISYERIDLVHTDKKEDLIADLEARTGRKITNVDILHIDFLRDTADLIIHYTSSEQDHTKPGMNTLPIIPDDENQSKIIHPGGETQTS